MAASRPLRRGRLARNSGLAVGIFAARKVGENFVSGASPSLEIKLRSVNADVRRMAAAPVPGWATFELIDAVSPELALVDPVLAGRVRGLLPEPSDTLERPPSMPSDTGELVPPAAQSRSQKPQVFPISFPDNGSLLEASRASAALQRLLEPPVDPSAQTSRVPRRRHLRRVATLVPTSSAAVATSLLVFQLYLSSGSLG